MRKHTITRDTAETKIEVDFLVDGEGKGNLDTGDGFLDHMLTLFTSHGLFDLNVYCDGDTEVDDHHTTEDIGIALRQTFKTAIRDKKGISRYASVSIHMDEAHATVHLDICGRSHLVYQPEGRKNKVGSCDTQGGQ